MRKLSQRELLLEFGIGKFVKGAVKHVGKAIVNDPEVQKILKPFSFIGAGIKAGTSKSDKGKNTKEDVKKPKSKPGATP